MDSNIELIKTYIDNKMTPILIRDELYDVFSSLACTLNFDCSLDLLNGSYDDNGNYVEPSWYKDAIDKRILVIRNIDSIPPNEQIKFMEILKYRKVNVFDLKDVIIVLTYKDNILNEQILSIATKVD